MVSKISAPFPERVGWYELLAPIGAGGMATVYLGIAARDGGFQRQVAVKMIHGTADSDSHLANDLLKEAKLAAKICHPNVVPVIDVGEDPNGLFLVMEYVEGDTLAGLRRTMKRLGERIPTPIGLRIVTDALAGLFAAHELKGKHGESLGVVHRDFSPHNILVGTDGVSRLTDFGIAKMAYTAGHTRTGKIKGKIAYMAPEQARGAKVDQRCDVWAAGAVAWEAIVGDRLYDTEDEIGALLKIVNEDPPRLRSVRPELPEELDDALDWALTRELAERCPSADALRRRLLAAHPVADTTDVAEFVRRVVGPKLADRRKKVEEIRRLRGRAGELAGALHEAARQPSPSFSGDREPSLMTAEEELEPQTDPPRTRDDTTGATIAWREQGGSGRAPGTSGVTDSVQRTISTALADRRNRAAIIGVASGAGIAFVLLGVISVSLMGRGAAADALASASASASAVGAAQPPRTATATATATPAPAPAPTPNEAKPQPFMVRANADIAKLTIGKEIIKITPASPEVGLPARPASGALVDAVAADGRTKRSMIPSSSDELVIEFAKRPTSGPGLRPGPKPGPTAGGGFADNPYTKK